MAHSSLSSDGSLSEALSAISSVVDIEETARRFKAFQRPRQVRSAADLLRLVLCYGAGLSLREGSAWADSASIAALSNPGFLQRLRNAPAWLEHIAQHLLERAPVQPSGTWTGRRLRVMDASSLCQPGADRTTWRLHVSYDLTGHVDGIELTDQSDVEHLSRFSCAPGDICIADRGYAKARDLRAVMATGADFVVRSGWRSLSFVDEQGGAFGLFDVLAQLGEQPQSRPVWVNSGEKGKPPIALRLVIARLPPEQAAKAREKLAINIRKRCRIGDPRSLEAAGFVVIVTSLDETYSATDILDLYRLRWQVELLFKRFKSLVNLGALPAKCPKLARTWIFAKLILALLAENTARNFAESSP
jgi:hypothetical protein